MCSYINVFNKNNTLRKNYEFIGSCVHKKIDLQAQHKIGNRKRVLYYLLQLVVLVNDFDVNQYIVCF